MHMVRHYRKEELCSENSLLVANRTEGDFRESGIVGQSYKMKRFLTKSRLSHHNRASGQRPNLGSYYCDIALSKKYLKSKTSERMKMIASRPLQLDKRKH